MITIRLNEKPTYYQEKEYSDEQLVEQFCQGLTEAAQREYGEGYVFGYEYAINQKPGYYKVYCNTESQLEKNTENYITFELRILYPKARQLLTREELASNPSDDVVEQKVEKRRKLMLAEIVYLSVRPPKHGVGTFLITSVLEELRKIKTIELVYLHLPDDASKGFWKKMGFNEPNEHNSLIKGKGYQEFVVESSENDFVYLLKKELR